ncbi:MAG: hypothetical protein ACI9T9_000764 [Oleiphilaceae bacterium]|jgi:hypothetical protein
MAELKVEIKILDSDEFNTLFELIADNFEGVPEPLKSKLFEWVESENKGWILWGDICPRFISMESAIVMLNGKSVGNVTGYNKILKKVTVMNEGWQLEEVVKAASFSINNINFDNFVEW